MRYFSDQPLSSIESTQKKSKILQTQLSNETQKLNMITPVPITPLHPDLLGSLIEKWLIEKNIFLFETLQF
jgi:hypothetical protein